MLVLWKFIENYGCECSVNIYASAGIYAKIKKKRASSEKKNLNVRKVYLDIFYLAEMYTYNCIATVGG